MPEAENMPMPEGLSFRDLLNHCFEHRIRSPEVLKKHPLLESAEWTRKNFAKAAGTNAVSVGQWLRGTKLPWNTNKIERALFGIDQTYARGWRDEFIKSLKTARDAQSDDNKSTNNKTNINIVRVPAVLVSSNDDSQPQNDPAGAHIGIRDNTAGKSSFVFETVNIPESKNEWDNELIITALTFSLGIIHLVWAISNIHSQGFLKLLDEYWIFGDLFLSLGIIASARYLTGKDYGLESVAIIHWVNIILLPMWIADNYKGEIDEQVQVFQIITFAISATCLHSLFLKKPTPISIS